MVDKPLFEMTLEEVMAVLTERSAQLEGKLASINIMPNEVEVDPDCPYCDGSGFDGTHKCIVCDGTGQKSNYGK